MVMPRSRSSGALSIESNERNLILGFFFDNTLVMAAVSVVFPWSMCPIVPTFTCGLLRSNFSFAIASPQNVPRSPWINLSVIALNSLVLLPELRVHALHPFQIKLAHQGLAGHSQPPVDLVRALSASGQHSIKLF